VKSTAKIAARIVVLLFAKANRMALFARRTSHAFQLNAEDQHLIAFL
jgi:hypothetical protein